MSTTKREGNIGREIKSVKVTSSKAIIIFKDGEKLTMPLSTYLNSSYLYKGKSLTKKEEETLLKQEEDSSAYNYFIKLVTYRPYSPRKLIEKLTNIKKLPYSKAKSLISRGIKEGIYNPSNYLESFIEESSSKGIALEKIKDDLLEEGYTYQEINECILKLDVEPSSIDALERSISKTHSRNINVFKENVISKLIKSGYSYSQARELIENKLDVDSELLDKLQEIEIQNLQNEFRHLQLILKDKYEKEELKKVIIERLSNRKYKYENIIKIVEEN